MYFATMEHYYDEDDYSILFITNKMLTTEHLENYLNTCFICYEEQDDSKNKIVNLFQDGFFIKTCRCKGNIHVNCFTQWYKKNQSCPMCRSKVIKYETYIIDVIYNYSNNILLFKMYINKFCVLFFKKLTIFFQIFIIIKMYSLVYDEVYNRLKQNSTQCSPHEL